MGVDSYLQFLSVLIIFILVLAATFYVTKWIANYQKGAERGKNIEVIETFRISNNKYIQIVRIGNRYVSIAVTNDHITNLGDVSFDELVLEESFNKNVSLKDVSFKEIFEKIKGEKKNTDDK